MSLYINGVGQDSFNMNGVSIDNLYVDDVLVWTGIPEVANIPRYEFTEALVDASTIDDSNNTLDTYNGKLTESDGTTPYEPTALQYPENGLLELDNGRIMDTQYTRQQSDAQYGIYGADGSTAYKIWAIDQQTGPIYTVYEGDQDTPLAVTFTEELTIPAGTMKITDERPSWLPSATPLRTPVYVNFWGSWNDVNPPSGIIINSIERTDTSVNSLVDIDNVSADYTVQIVTEFSGAASGTTTGDNSGCVSDQEIDRGIRHTVTNNIDIYLPEGTYDVLVSAFKNTVTTEYNTDYTLDGVTKTILASSDSAEHCQTFTSVVSTGETFRLQVSPSVSGSGFYAYINSLRITEV